MLLCTSRRVWWSAGAPLDSGPPLGGHIFGARNLKFHRTQAGRAPLPRSVLLPSKGSSLHPSGTQHIKGCSHGANCSGRAKAFQHPTALILLCLPDRIQQSTSGLIKLHCTRLQRTRINRRGRFPQPARTFWSTKVREEEITLSKKPELICSK